MGFFEQLKRRRVLPWLGAYLAGGFLFLEGVAQLEGYGFLPVLAYRIALVFYLFGIPGTIVLAWYHGEKGQQDLARTEIWIQSVLLVGAFVATALVVRDYRRDRVAEIDFAAEMGLNPRGVAVLVFEDLDGEYGFAADGLTGALIDRLSSVRGLDVISRNGVEQFRDQELHTDSIARVLDVRNVITGSVEPRGDEMRITVRLVDGFSGVDVEAERFDVPAEDLLSAQDSLAATIATFLRERLGTEVQIRETRRETSSLEAWSLVQRAERLLRNAEEARDREDIEAELSLLATADSTLALAEAADPEWVAPLARRAQARFTAAVAQGNYVGDMEASVAAARSGLEHAERALARSPRDAAALEARGSLRYVLWLLDQAEGELEDERLLEAARDDLDMAVDNDPTRARAWRMLSLVHGAAGDLSASLIAGRRAYEEDAYLRNARLILEDLFWGHFDLEQLNEAREWCQEGGARFPGDVSFVECRLALMLSPIVEADPDSAWALQARLVELAPEARREFEERWGYLHVAGVLRQAGLPDSAEAVFERGRGSDVIDPESELLGMEARIRAYTGDRERAMDVLQRYVAAQPRHSFGIGDDYHWMWRPLRDHPDFRSVMERN